MVFLIVTHLSLIKTGVIKKIPEAAEVIADYSLISSLFC